MPHWPRMGALRNMSDMGDVIIMESFEELIVSLKEKILSATSNP